VHYTLIFDTLKQYISYGIDDAIVLYSFLLKVDELKHKRLEPLVLKSET